MSLTLVTDPSQVGFNGYASAAEVIAYEESKRGTAFAAATTSAQIALIINATRLVDQLEWMGWMTNPLQNHQWPRAGVWRDGKSRNQWDVDGLIYSSYQFDSATIPQFIKDFTAELCLQLIVSNIAAPTGLEGFKSVKVSDIALEVNAKDRLSWMTDESRNLVWRWLANSSKYNAPVVRV